MAAQQPGATSSAAVTYPVPVSAAQDAPGRQVYRQERVFISHAGPQKGFALHLRTQLRDAGVSTFVDERELLPGDDHSAAAVMEAACRQAQLVVFVVTRDFLRRHATVQELRWALDQRQQQQGTAAAGGTSPAAALPHLLTVLYPMSLSPSWRVPELQQLLSGASLLAPGADAFAVAQQLDVATNDATVDVGELSSGSLSGLLRLYHPSASVADGVAVTAQQAAADLSQLAEATVIRLDSAARGDDLLLHTLFAAAQRILLPYMQLSMGQLVGLEPQLQRIRAALAPGAGLQLHGLYGLGGIGKSTLARQFFEEAKSQFTRHCFVHVGQEALSGPALISKQQDLLKSIGGQTAASSDDAVPRAALRSSFQSGGPLLLVLDDLWDERQLAALLGYELSNNGQLSAGTWAVGSRVLITSRNKTLVSGRIDGAAEPQQMAVLPELAAQQLLCLHAFEKGVWPPEFSEQQMAAAVAMCGGLPLTLRLLGGALRRHTGAPGWQAVLGDWSSASGPADDSAVLTKSYEALPSNAHRRMFLDAALLLHGQPAQHLTALWAAQLQLDDSQSGGNAVFRGSGWRSRGTGAVTDCNDELRQKRHAAHCQQKAAQMLTELGSAALLDEVAGENQVALRIMPPVARLWVHDRLRDMASQIASEFGRGSLWRLSDMAADDVLPEGSSFAADRLRCVQAAGAQPAVSLAQVLRCHTGLQLASFEQVAPETRPRFRHLRRMLGTALIAERPPANKDS